LRPYVGEARTLATSLLCAALAFKVAVRAHSELMQVTQVQ
jgi:hypothetical protein